MRGAAERGVFHRLNRLECGAGRVLDRLRHVHRPAHRTAGVDAGAARLVREADEVRIVEAVAEVRQVLALAIDHVEHRLRIRRPLTRFVLLHCLDVEARIRNLAGGQDYQVRGQRDFLIQDHVLELEFTAGRHFLRPALGEVHALLLRAAVEILAVARRAQVGVQDHGIDVFVLVLEVHRLLDRGVATVTRTVAELALFRAALTGALHEHHAFHFLAVGALDGAAVGLLRQRFQAGLVGDAGGLAVAVLRQLAGIVLAGAGGHDDGTDIFGRGRTRLGRDIDTELAGRTAGLGDGGVEHHLDALLGLHFLDQVGDTGIGRIGVRFAVRHALPQLGGPAAERAGLLHQQRLVAGLGGFQRRGQAGDTATDHQDTLVVAVIRIDLRQLHLLDLGTAHADHVIGHFLGQFLFLVVIRGRAHPDHTFAQVGAAQGHAVEAEGLGLGAPRAGGDDHVIHAVVGDVILDEIDPRRRAQEVVRLDDLDLALAGGDGFELRDVEPFADPAALAKVRTNFHISHICSPTRFARSSCCKNP